MVSNSATSWLPDLQHASPLVMGVLYLLIGLSLLTWFFIILKGLEFWRAQRTNQSYAQKFWEVAHLASFAGGTDAGPCGQFAQLTENGLQALNRYRKQQGVMLGRGGDPTETITRALRQTIQDSMTKLETGLGLLATIGNTAPFIGLFGTVVGIMSALSGISRTGAAGLDVVAGPIGEALIATAVGLACAIPAVVAYNSFVRRLRVLGNSLDGFAHDLLARIIAENPVHQAANLGLEG
jgi:biopolymer transport protein ExbB